MYQQQTQEELHETQNRYSKQTKLANNPKRAMQEMMETIDTLKNVYELETEALDRLDVKRFMSLQDEKIEFARLYQDGIAQLLSRQEDLKSVDPETRERLEIMQKEFSELANRNMAALQKMQKTMERFGGTLREAAKDAVKKDRSNHYTASGRMDLDDAKRITTGTISETA